MSHPLRLVLAVHNHQPVGNFDGVMEQAYQDSYRPFLDIFQEHDDLRISLHVSGALLEWLDGCHPQYLDRLAELSAAGRVEIIGGAFYEPILTMIPTVDRIGQIQSFTRCLRRRLGVDVRGMWVPERVWEPALTRDLVDAGIEYTLLDDFHFKNAGLVDEQLSGYFLTEDEGRVLKIFPGSERLRYLIPFGEPQETIDYLRRIHKSRPGAVVLFGDDGEKFGTWPETKRHVYNDGWLARFFNALVENREWLQCTTMAEAVDSTPPAGKIYLPEASYREMTEWVLPPQQHVKYERLCQELENDPRWLELKQFVRGGFWRNFKVRYSESNEMYARMMAVSRKLQSVVESGEIGEAVSSARVELYRAQCNCAYWHGAFGGIYLPHLRNAVFLHLIAADNLLDRIRGRSARWVEAIATDLDFDARPELQLASDKLVALLAPGRGGQLYELDARSIGHNLLATLCRRPEAYHLKVAAGTEAGAEMAASIHDRISAKQEGLENHLRYDSYPRKSLIDHFRDREVTLEQVAAGEYEERGDFVFGAYEARLRRSRDRVRARLSRRGMAWECEITLTKIITLAAGRSVLEIEYQIEDLPHDAAMHFAVEFNFAGMPAEADDRFYFDQHQNRLAHLGSRLDLPDVEGFGLLDEWLGLAVRLDFSRPTHIWTYPIHTVSLSEGGFELVHQSVVVEPHWIVHSDGQGRWNTTIQLNVDTSMAEEHNKTITATSPVAAS